MRYLVLLGVVFVFLSGCAAHESSQYTEGKVLLFQNIEDDELSEIVKAKELAYDEQTNRISVVRRQIPGSQPFVVPGTVTIAAVAFALETTASFIKNKIDEEKKKYVAQYGNKLVGTSIFEYAGQPLSTITLVRIAKDKDKKGELNDKNKYIMSSFVQLQLVKTKNKHSPFTFVLKDSVVRYSSCKIKKSEGKKDNTYPKIDLTVDVSIKCYYRQCNTPKVSSMGNIKIPIKNMSVIADLDDITKYRRSDERVYSWFAPYPAGDVAYSLEFTVGEYDDYMEFVSKYGRLTTSANEGLIDIINAWVESGTQ